MILHPRHCIYSGTVTNANMTATLADGSADIDFASGTIPRNYKGCLLDVFDSTGKKISGYVYTDGAGNVQNIVSAKGGSTRNWTWKDAGFNNDDASNYSYRISRTPPVLVASDTYTAANARFDLTSTNAFAEFAVNLSGYHGGNYLLCAYDSSGYAAIGHIKASAPLGETLSGSELFTNANFDAGDSGWTKGTNWTIVDQGGGDYEGVATGAAVDALMSQTITHEIGALYKGTGVCTNYTAGGVRLFLNSGATVGSTLTGLGTSTAYYSATATSKTAGMRVASSAATLRIDDMSCQRVTDCAITGALIVSAKGGATRSWTTKHASFNPNSAGTYKIFYLGN